MKCGNLASDVSLCGQLGRTFCSFSCVCVESTVCSLNYLNQNRRSIKVALSGRESSSRSECITPGSTWSPVELAGVNKVSPIPTKWAPLAGVGPSEETGWLLSEVDELNRTHLLPFSLKIFQLRKTWVLKWETDEGSF